MTDLPSEVITDILSRLPVPSLLQFRSISKSWKSLIDSRHFTNLHLKNSLTFKSNTNLILRRDSELYYTDFLTLTTATPLNHPLMCYSNHISLLGSCNGLLCISNVADDIAFWNPSLRQHRIIPYLPIRNRPDPDTSLFAARVHGFGFDQFSGDYKLVRISYFVDLHNRSFDSQVTVFSSRKSSWKSLPSMPYALCCARTMGVLVHDALHWVVTRKLEPGQPDFIIGFDLSLEIFHEVVIPEIGVGDGDGFEIEVAELGGCLCMVVNYLNIKVDVWVMKDYGSRDSWCKLFSLVETLDLRSLKSVRPLGYSCDGIRILLEQDRRKLFWYNLRSEQVSCVRIPGMQNLSEGVICVGSLVPPTLPKENCRKQQHQLRCENNARKRRDDFLSQGFKLTL